MVWRDLRPKNKPKGFKSGKVRSTKKAKSTKTKDDLLVFCHGIGPEYCDNRGKQIFVCHYDETLDEYQTICVSDQAAKDHFETYGQDRCGQCQAATFRIMQALERIESPMDAHQKLDSQDLEVMIHTLKGVLPRELKGFITESNIINAMFPREVESEEENQDDVIRGRDLAVYKAPDREGRQDRNLSLDESCWDELGAFLVSLLFMALAVMTFPFPMALALAQPVANVVAGKLLSQVATRSTYVAFSFLDDFERAWAAGDVVKTIWNGWKSIKLVLDITGGKTLISMIYQEFKNGLKNMSALELTELFVEMVATFVVVFATAAELPLLAALAVGPLVGFELNHVVEDAIDLFDCLLPPCNTIWMSECEPKDLCTHDIQTCSVMTGNKWECTHPPVMCPDDTICDPLDGECKPYDPVIPCSEPCDSGTFCDPLNGECMLYNPLIPCPEPCMDREFCDPWDGVCKPRFESIPCVAVVNGDPEDWDLFWTDFRTLDPIRPFCLLIPGSGVDVHVPQDFLNDDYTTVHASIGVDDGINANAVDWAHLCGLDQHRASHVLFVGLYIDDSSSLGEQHVSASRDVFIRQMKEQGIAVKKLTSSTNNWHQPFLVDFNDRICVVDDYQWGWCLYEETCDQRKFFDDIQYGFHIEESTENFCQDFSDQVGCCTF